VRDHVECLGSFASFDGFGANGVVKTGGGCASDVSVAYGLAILAPFDRLRTNVVKGRALSTRNRMGAFNGPNARTD
jgi:hypothetical protein